MGLPVPRGRQREVLYLPASGHTVVLGTAGSGKTTLAIHRAFHLSDPATPHSGPTLLLTFNRALAAFLKYLARELDHDITIENYHAFARGYLKSRGELPDRSICDPAERRWLIQGAVGEVRSQGRSSSILDRPLQFLEDELAWIAQHGIESEDDYERVERVGRVEFRVRRGLERSSVFAVYEVYIRLRRNRGRLYDWDDIAHAVTVELSQDPSVRRYKHIIIDEGQDFSPEMLRSLASAVPGDGSITFFGDAAQQIYGHRISWRSAGFNVSDVWNFQENYRNSREIANLALSISKMPYFAGTPDLVEPKSPVAAGPPPTIVDCSSVDQEVRFVCEQAREMARTQTVAILVRSHADERIFRQGLAKATSLDRYMQWSQGPRLFIGTYHGAKGLEFDAVILPNLTSDRWPDSDTVTAFGAADGASRDGKLLYVGVTRARTRLIMTHSGTLSELLPAEQSLYARVKL